MTASLGASHEALTVTSTAATKLSITLEQSSGPGALVPQRLPSFTLQAGATARISPSSWHGKSSSVALVTISQKHHHTRKLRLKAHARRAVSPLHLTTIKQSRAGKHVFVAMTLKTPKLPSGSTESVTAFLSTKGKHTHSYKLLASRPAAAGKRKLTLKLPASAKGKHLRIVLASVSGKTGALAIRSSRLAVSR